MALDPSIALQYKPFQVEPQANALARILQLQGVQQQNALGGLQLQEQQNTINERNALRDYLGNTANNIDTPEGQAGLYKAAPTQAAGILKGRLDLKSTQSTIDLNAAKAAEAAFKTMHDKATAMSDLISTATDQASYDAAKARGQAMGLTLDPNAPAQYDPKYVASQLAQAQTAKDRIEQQAKQRGLDLTERGQNMTAATAKAGQQVQLATNAATNATSTANNAATNATHLQAAGMAPGGGMDENSERTAQAIASGQLPAPTGMALLNPKNQRILGRVMEINPQYDSTTVAAKQKAAKDFTTGSQGNAMRSFAVAGDHLDQLGQLADAMNNGNLQIVNKVANAYAQQTGNPAPTNFDAAKDVVSKEVVKAIVAGGGGVAERQELSTLMSNAKSPAQLKGVIAQYRNLMAAQHDALLQQRRAAGLPDSTLPAYSNNGQGNADLHSQADAILKGK